MRAWSLWFAVSVAGALGPVPGSSLLAPGHSIGVRGLRLPGRLRGTAEDTPPEDPFWGLCPDEGGLDPRRFVRVSPVGIRRVDRGAVLTCAVAPDQKVLGELSGGYFPLFLNSEVTASVFQELGSHTLPDVLASLPNVAQCDLVQIGIRSFESTKSVKCSSAVFIVVDESMSDKPPHHVVELDTSAPIALGLSIKSIEPFFLSASALLSSNADFIDRAATDPRVGPGHDAPTRGWLPHQVQVIESLQSDTRDLGDRFRLAEAWLERAKEGDSASALAAAAEARQEVEADIWSALPDIITRCDELDSKRMKLFFSSNTQGEASSGVAGTDLAGTAGVGEGQGIAGGGDSGFTPPNGPAEKARWE